MIDKLVTLYRKAEMGFISGLSGASASVADETCFYDVGFMQTQISRIQKEMKRIENDVSTSFEVGDNSDYGKKRRAELMGQRERLLFRLIFLASNSFANLDDCVKIGEGHSFVFMDCVEALTEYHAGNRDKAFQIFESYYQKHGSVEGHYLVNKVFGLLLAGKGNYQKAIPFLTYALQFMPDDTECLDELKKCYKQTGKGGRADTISEILEMLA